MNILGLQFGHDAGIAILSDGIPVTNMIRERHNRAKHAFGINVSHIEESLAQANMSIKNIDMIAITSGQNYELVVVDQPEQFKIEYNPHPDVDVKSTLYEILIKEQRSVTDRLVQTILERTYTGKSEIVYAGKSETIEQYYRGMFPEYKNIPLDKLGITGFLSDYIIVSVWKEELGLTDIANLDLGPLLFNNDVRLGLHYPITVTFKNHCIPGICVQHHAAHAASVFYTTPTDQAAVMTHDGGFYQVGPNNGMIFYGDDNRLWPIVPNHLAIGDLYDRVGTSLGFDLSGAPGKLMGLAPYGKPRFFNRDMVGNTYDLRKKGINDPLKHWWDHCIKTATSFGYDLSGLGNVNRILDPISVDIAASTQKLMEETTLNAAEAISKMFNKAGLPMDTFCYAGGTGLNCPTNSRLLAEGPFQNVYIPPHCDDSGLSMGAAQYLYHNVMDKPRTEQSSKKAQDFPYLGFHYGKDAVESAIHAVHEKVEAQYLTDATEQAAEDINNDKIIAWFEGRSEIGPRALGHRSLLANPRHASNWERLNQLKSREKWRPFAPAVLQEDASSFFRGHPNDSPHMLFTAQVCTPELPAITHVDGSSRIQTVTEETGGLFHILKHLKTLSGFAVVLNTSFNGPGEPIVEKPEEALEFLLSTNLDVLYLENYQVIRRSNHSTKAS